MLEALHHLPAPAVAGNGVLPDPGCGSPLTPCLHRAAHLLILHCCCANVRGMLPRALEGTTQRGFVPCMFAHACMPVEAGCGCVACTGIIAGMCVLGFLGDRIGRKWGSVCTASIMLLGAVMLTCSNGANPKGFTVMFLISQCIFGYATWPGLLHAPHPIKHLPSVEAPRHAMVGAWPPWT